jgi:hypothetical protein
MLTNVGVIDCSYISVVGRTEVRVFENRELRKTCGPKWEKVAGDRRKQHSEELRDLCCEMLLG